MKDDRARRPWWKFGLLWMVIAGPALMVMISFTLAYLAVTFPDPVEDSYYHQGAGTHRGAATLGAVPKAPVATQP
ncbi:FixH family protein [Polaromonas sp. C04]|uniref:FixH family protein n=1 Tax=Polaromonas sp. C04 TaxID=1945857 RepID=UPI000986A1DB|nr:FixH family protein [Polaromonas sp. C04]